MRRLRNRKESQSLGTIDLKPGERLDELQRNNYRIIQDPERFCFGMDAVLLSGFAKAQEGARVLDLGTGTGIIPILMAAKTKAKEETDRLVDAAKETIENERKAAMTDIKNEIANISIKVAEKILEKELSTDEAQLKYINEIIKETDNQ